MFFSLNYSVYYEIKKTRCWAHTIIKEYAFFFGLQKKIKEYIYA